MEPEVATEAYSDLVDVPWCDKNQNHDGFQSLDDFSLEDLPAEFRNEEILSYIRMFSARVVRISVKKPTGILYGSGAVFKLRDSFLILTNQHVVGSEEDVQNCTVDFFYDTADGKGKETSYGQAVIGCSELQDRCAFSFYPIPQKIREIPMFDNAEIFADVVFRLDGDIATEVACNGYVHKSNNKWLVGVNLPQGDLEHLECDVYFRAKHIEEPMRARFVRIDHTDGQLLHIEIDEVPEFVQAASLNSWVAPWPMGNPHFTPFVISHPHGGPKRITQGKCLTVELDGDVGKLIHTAKTCPGSSGGLVITVGGDASHYLQYAAYLCIHCEGEKCDVYRGMSVETGNINLSLFNSS